MGDNFCVRCSKWTEKNIDLCRDCQCYKRIGNYMNCVYKNCLEQASSYVYCQYHGILFRESDSSGRFEEWASSR